MEHFDILLVVRKEFYVVYYIPNEEFYLLYTSVIFVEMPLETCHFTGIAVKCNTSEINCERSEVSVSERAEQALPDQWVPREKLYLGNEAFWTYGAGNKKCLF